MEVTAGKHPMGSIAVTNIFFTPKSFIRFMFTTSWLTIDVDTAGKSCQIKSWVEEKRENQEYVRTACLEKIDITG